ncbi:uracil-DNA glycosylase family protein [Pseudomonas sp. Q2-TVG4-2]|uniref:uracil-DNA glycosylase family protein n=1 Tax=Pseudomonas sp. Q2-TVG4-2 TaxID=1685699 RepID=UPI0015E760F6|nr:uracil-DNA glycosylase family protein [Pseudomonas sp. Q2-TVG4-2]
MKVTSEPKRRLIALDQAQHEAFRALAAETDGIDVAVYEQFEKDPLEPIIGLGRADAPLAFFGRDPGREEVRYGEPFIGGGGQLVRRGLYRHLHGEDMPDFEAGRALGEAFFWINTVPYKPLGNRAWSVVIKRRFHPLMQGLLIENWRGRDIVTLGREAFLWFGMEQSREVRRQLEAYWQREDRFTAHFDIELATEQGAMRTFRLHPLPHPSPRNLTWFKRFPALLETRLQQLLD